MTRMGGDQARSARLVRMWVTWLQCLHSAVRWTLDTGHKQQYCYMLQPLLLLLCMMVMVTQFMNLSNGHLSNHTDLLALMTSCFRTRTSSSAASTRLVPASSPSPPSAGAWQRSWAGTRTLPVSTVYLQLLSVPVWHL